MRIDKHIAIPPLTHNTGLSATLQKLRIGHSFIYKGEYRPAHNAARKIGIRVAARKVARGYRIWRVA